MKYSTNSSDYNHSTLFCEQVQQLTTMYEQWNDCERTVVIYALFKRLPFANLKFLTHSIDHFLKQSYAAPNRLSHLEDAANAITFLNKLIQKYNALISITTSNDKIDANSDQDISLCGNDAKSLEDDLVTKYVSKEEIVQDLLMYLPLLRPNNDEGKKVFMQFVPALIEDSIKNNLPIELVQQILSYLLIHPAIKNEDRKSLHQWLRQLEDHISSSYLQPSTSSSFAQLPSDNASSFLSTASSISSASSSSSTASSTTWPTTVPQQPLTGKISVKAQQREDMWDLRNFQIPQDYCDASSDLNQATTKYPTPIGNNKSASQSSLNNSKGTTNTSSSMFDSNDEHHISFSKNGTEIVDFDSDFGLSASDGSKSITGAGDFLTVPSMFNDNMFDIYGISGNSGFGTFSDGAFSDDGNAIKTRRSNSLTTPTASATNSGVHGEFTSSVENLASLQLKPRSFSLSMESSRNGVLMSSGSETCLDDYSKMTNAHLRFMNNGNNNTSGHHHVGMGNIGVWLKSLRLHKYFWLFTNMSYEQMMEMTEEYLENLGVTKGARHKLVLCIQKLAERVTLLRQIENELVDVSRPLKSALDELTNIILTPMKPINTVPSDEDVATHVLRVLDCAFTILLKIKYLTSADEESVNVFMWLIDKALHHDAFQQQATHLKEYKYKLSRVKMTFGGHNKMHYNSIGGGNNMKMRWNSKPGNKPSGASQSDQQKLHRKSSIPYYHIGSLPAYQNQNKNSSSFSTPPSQLSNFQRSASREKLNQFSVMQQQHHHQFSHQPSVSNSNSSSNNQSNGPVPAYHRHSLNNLMPPFSAHQQFMNRRNSSCTDRLMPSPGSLLSSASGSGAGSHKNLSEHEMPSATSDINSRLESLCRQMTEQAIN